MAAALGLIEATPDEKAVAIKENFDYFDDYFDFIV